MILLGNSNYLWVYNPAEDTGATFTDTTYGDVSGSGWKIVKMYDA
jgi:hypothetical protein